jgi:hypothetical protein
VICGADCCGYEPSARPSFKDIIRRLKPILKTLPPWNPSATPTAAAPAPYSPAGRTQAAPARPAPIKAPVRLSLLYALIRHQRSIDVV